MNKFRQILLFSSAFLLTMILSELFIRTSHLASVSSKEYYDDIGSGRRKNLKYLYFNEGFGIGKFNKYRYIGEANSSKKSKNTIRIALVGDSYVESFHVFERDYFGNFSEKTLKEQFPEKDFEFLNFGMSGFDIGNMYAYHRTFVDKFNPDYILYMISEINLVPNYKYPLRPKTILENDSIVISFDFPISDINNFKNTKFLMQHSSIINMINNGRIKSKKTPIQETLFDKIYYWIKAPKELSKSNKKDVLKYNIDPVTVKIINTLDSEKVIVVNRSGSEWPIEFHKLCLDNGFSFIDLSKTLDLMKRSGNDPNEWKVTRKRGHWNHAAHKAVGEEIANQLIKIIDE